MACIQIIEYRSASKEGWGRATIREKVRERERERLGGEIGETERESFPSVCTCDWLDPSHFWHVRRA